MRIDDSAYARLPDFSTRLQAAMDHAGLTPRQVADGLREWGLGTNPAHVHRLLKGETTSADDGIRRRANPTLILVAALAEVCQVPVTWFFDNRPGLTLDDLRD